MRKTKMEDAIEKVTQKSVTFKNGVQQSGTFTKKTYKIVFLVLCPESFLREGGGF